MGQWIGSNETLLWKSDKGRELTFRPEDHGDIEE